MSSLLLKSVGASVVIASVLVFLKPADVTVANESPTASAKSPALKTVWGEPDIQGIWTARTLEMSDLRRGSRTRLTLDKLEYDVRLEDVDFTLQAIRR